MRTLHRYINAPYFQSFLEEFDWLCMCDLNHLKGSADSAFKSRKGISYEKLMKVIIEKDLLRRINDLKSEDFETFRSSTEWKSVVLERDRWMVGYG